MQFANVADHVKRLYYRKHVTVKGMQFPDKEEDFKILLN